MQLKNGYTELGCLFETNSIFCRDAAGSIVRPTSGLTELKILQNYIKVNVCHNNSEIIKDSSKIFTWSDQNQSLPKINFDFWKQKLFFF